MAVSQARKVLGSSTFSRKSAWLKHFLQKTAMAQALSQENSLAQAFFLLKKISCSSRFLAQAHFQLGSSTLLSNLSEYRP